MGLWNTETHPQCRRSQSPREAGRGAGAVPWLCPSRHLRLQLEARGHGLVCAFGLSPLAAILTPRVQKNLPAFKVSVSLAVGGDRRTAVTSATVDRRAAVCVPAEPRPAGPWFLSSRDRGLPLCKLVPKESSSTGAASRAPP